MWSYLFYNLKQCTYTMLKPEPWFLITRDPEDPWAHLTSGIFGQMDLKLSHEHLVHIIQNVERYPEDTQTQWGLYVIWMGVGGRGGPPAWMTSAVYFFFRTFSFWHHITQPTSLSNIILCASCVHNRALGIGQSLWLQGHKCHNKWHYLWRFFVIFESDCRDTDRKWKETKRVAPNRDGWLEFSRGHLSLWGWNPHHSATRCPGWHFNVGILRVLH